MLTHVSFFSGIGGFDLGLEQAGWETVAQSEIEPFACSILKTHWPNIPNLGDITKIDYVPEALLWTGGFPCQDLSIAGRRLGFNGERSSLAFSFLNLAEKFKPKWIILENVYGLFSSNGGADFGRLLYEMAQLGYGVAWRVFDSQYFGVPQRRRRIFIVGSLGTNCSQEVLFDSESRDGNSSQGVEKGKNDTNTITECFDEDSRPTLLTGRIARTLTSRYRIDGETDNFVVGSRTNDIRSNGRVLPNTNIGESSSNIESRHRFRDRLESIFLLAYLVLSPDSNRVREVTRISLGLDDSSYGVHESQLAELRLSTVMPTLQSKGGKIGQGYLGSLGEYESTDILDQLNPNHLDYRRYGVLGNAVTVPVAKYLGERLKSVILDS